MRNFVASICCLCFYLLDSPLFSVSTDEVVRLSISHIFPHFQLPPLFVASTLASHCSTLFHIIILNCHFDHPHSDIIINNPHYNYHIIHRQLGNTGMWTHDITRAAGLQNHVVQRAVKNLSDQKKLIKPLKSIHQKNRKIYILVNLEPSKEVIIEHWISSCFNLLHQRSQRVVNIVNIVINLIIL